MNQSTIQHRYKSCSCILYLYQYILGGGFKHLYIFFTLFGSIWEIFSISLVHIFQMGWGKTTSYNQVPWMACFKGQGRYVYPVHVRVGPMIFIGVHLGIRAYSSGFPMTGYVGPGVHPTIPWLLYIQHQHHWLDRVATESMMKGIMKMPCSTRCWPCREGCLW